MMLAQGSNEQLLKTTDIAKAESLKSTLPVTVKMAINNLPDEKKEAFKNFKEALNKEIKENKNWFQKLATFCKSEWVTISAACIATPVAFVLGLVLAEILPIILFIIAVIVMGVCGVRLMSGTDEFVPSTDTSVGTVKKLTGLNAPAPVRKLSLLNVICILLTCVGAITALLAIVSCVAIILGFVVSLPFICVAIHKMLRKIGLACENGPKTSKQALASIINKAKESTVVVPASIKNLFASLPVNINAAQAHAFVNGLLKMCAIQENVINKEVIS